MAKLGIVRKRSVLRIGLLSWVFTSMLLLAYIIDPYAAAASPLQFHGALQREHDIGIVAHRGAAALAPENTLAAFRLAVEQGVDFVEIDVRLTADGVPVLMHDADLDRTTSGSGPLAAHTLEQVQALDAGRWFSPEYAGEPVPTLEQFVALLGPAPARAFVELKGEWAPEQIAAVVELLRSNQLVHRVVLASFEIPALEQLRQQAPEYATILLTRELSDEMLETALSLRVSAVCAREQLFAESPEFFQRITRVGIGAIAYTLNAPEQWETAEATGVDFLVTDDPVALAAWRASRVSLPE